ncbi:glycoside hydrolase family 113 [Isoptericola aurantiacus]|uniref:glycoside hydrolase family 113 n=1 Tax=Isoptericola aurantiacus TaxID=3377839 RepID=UPI00383A1B87
MTAAGPAASPGAAEVPVVPLPGGPVLGMTWGWTGVRGTWATPESERSLDAMVAELATTWTAVTYAAVQATAQSTRIPFREAPALTDDEVRWAVRAAKARGQRVCLKPVVNVADGTWRAHIGFLEPDVPNEPTWDRWFASYTEFVVHHARIAAQEGAEMFCVGCEMVRSDPHAEQWRAVIAAVREVYDGLVTYNCDKYQEDRLTWWDAVDVMSASGYYPLGGWEAQLDRIAPVVARERKPFFFMETGCPSRTGSAALPNDWTLQGPPDGGEQEAWYRDMLAATSARPWVQGWVLWDWPATLYARQDAAGNDDYCPSGKPAAEVIAATYRRLGGTA